MFGGTGSDTYFVTSTRDRVTEVPGGSGTDTVVSTISFTLAADVETLRLVGGDLNGTGNAQANLIVGTAGRNLLDGAAGPDTMEGGLGNDTYFVDDVNDVVIEAAGPGSGRDTVRAAVTYTLVANVENLILTGGGVINGTGNAAANVVTGNGKANVLDGREGNDTLTGGLGRDAFVFSTLPGTGNIDRITDFTPGEDRIHLDADIFTALAPGALFANRFVIGLVALDANDFILYDPATGTLRYDQDGSGANESVVFAVLDNAAAITNAGFLII
jgi:Ca2+-binding RTX toxin-like protein